MGKNLEAVRMYGDDASAVSVAPIGTTAPVALAALAVTYVDLGWLGDDGISIKPDVEVKKVRAHQGGAKVKTKVTSTERSFTFVCLEETAVVLGLMHPGATGVTTTGVSVVAVPAGTMTDPRAWIIDEWEGAIQTRYIIPRGTVGDRGELVYKNDEVTAYQFTVELDGGFTFVTNSTSVTYP